MKMFGSLMAAAAAAMLLLGCGTLTEPAPTSAAGLSDTDISGMVMTRLQSDPTLDAGPVSVSTRQGVVTVYGTAPDVGTAARIKAQIRATPGVRGVIDELSIY